MLKELTSRDQLLAQKELTYAARHLDSRMVAKSERAFSADETSQTDIPAFLRCKSAEGRGRRQP